MIQSNSTPTPTPMRDSILDVVGRKIGYAVTIGVTIVMIVVVQFVPDWDLSFIQNSKFEDWIPYFYLSCAASILANLFLLALDPYRLRHAMQIFINIFSLISVLAMIRIYPFDFGDDGDTIARVVLWLGVLGICISFISEGVQVITGQRAKAKSKDKAKNEKLKNEFTV